MNKPNLKPSFGRRSPRPHFMETVERDVVVEPEAPAEPKEPLIYRNIVSTCANLGWGGKVVDKSVYRAPSRAVRIVQVGGEWRELSAMPAFLRERGAPLPPNHFVSGSPEHIERRRELGWL
jgi:hypothetical protein